MLQPWVTASQLSFLATLLSVAIKSYLTFYLEFVGHNAFSVMVAEKREATLLSDVFFFVMTRMQGAVWATPNRLTVTRVWAFMHGSVYRPIVSCPLCREKSAFKRCSATPSEMSAPEKPISQIISDEI